MVSNASEDLPEPESPVITTRRSRGISRLMFLRLCSRAPRIISLSAICLCSSAPRRVACLYHAPRIIDRGNHARRIRDAARRDIERGAMVGRSPDEWQSDRDVHRTIKLQSLERDQALIMIHSHSRVEAEVRAVAHECGIRGQRPERLDALLACAPDCRCDDARLLIAEKSVLAAVWIETEHADARIDGAFVLAQMPMENRDGVAHIFLRQQRRYFRKTHMHRDQREPEFASRKHHAPVFRAPDFRHHLAMTREMMPRLVPPMFADGRGDECVDFAFARHPRAPFHISKRCVSAFDARLAGPARIAG